MSVPRTRVLRAGPLVTAAVAAVVVVVPAVVVPAAPAAAATTPVVLNATESAGPGDVVALQGAGFGATPTVYAGVAGGTGGPVQLRVLTRSATAVTAVLPAGLGTGVYGLIVNNGTANSPPVYVNRARVMSVEHQQIAAGYSFRLFGRNLTLPGATPAAVLTDTTTGATLTPAVDREASDPYQLKLWAPAGLVPGRRYTIAVGNGAGGATGVVTAGEQVTAVTSRPDPYGLGVPWLSNFDFLGNVYNVRSDARLGGRLAEGDGTTNDLAAVQHAVNTAHAAGGGVVYLPAGTYKLTGVLHQTALTVPSEVVLRGDGMDRSVLTFDSPTGGPSYGTAVLLPDGTTRVGFVDLAVRTTTYAGLSLRNAGGPAEIFSLRTAWSTSQLHGVVWSGNHGGKCSFDPASCAGPFAFKDSKVTSTVDLNGVDTGGVTLVPAFQLSRARNSLVSGNTFAHRYWRLCFDFGLGNVVERNTVLRQNVPGRPINARVSFGAFTFSGSIDTVVQHNGFDGTDDYPFNNDGESIMYEQISDRYHKGTATAGGERTLTDPAGVGAADLWAGLTATIVAGPGAGQSRRVVSNTATTVTVDRPWTVPPAAGSRYTLQYQVTGAIIRGNTIANAPRGIWFFDVSLDDVAVVANKLGNAEGILVRTLEHHTNNQFTPVSRVLIADNALARTRAPAAGTSFQRAYVGVHYEDLTTGGPFGTAAFLVEVRRNAIAAVQPNLGGASDPWGVADGYYAKALDATLAGRPPTTDTGTPVLLGTVFDANASASLDNAYTLSTGAHQSVIWRSTGTNVGNLLRDIDRDLGRGSTGTVVGP